MTKTELADQKIARANARFDKLPKWKQRVAVCKDVLKMLASKKLVAKHCYLFSDTLLRAAQNNPDESFQKFISSPKESCTVCAKGAIFCATVARRNRVTVDQADRADWEGDPLSKTLGGVFSPKQLALIENAYERDQMDNLASETDFLDDVSTSDGDIVSNEDLLIAIMKNIIRNKGTFKPTRKG